MSRTTATLILAALVAGVATWRIAVLPDSPQSLIYSDEFHYAQQARDIAGGSFPRYNRAFAPKMPPAYAATLAPIRRLAGRDRFWWWSRVWNALLYASIAIPAYRLARVGASRGAALVASGVALATPAIVYVPVLMAENLFVPLSLWLGVLVVRSAARPTRPRLLATGAILGVVVLTKTLAAALAPAVVLAILGRRLLTWRGLADAAWVALSTACVVGAWRARTALFGPSASGPELFAYSQEIARAGSVPLARYAHWIAVHLAAPAVALTPPLAALAVGGALAGLGDARPARRALGRWTLGAIAGLVAVTGFFLANIEWMKPVAHTRYLVPLWPLLAVGAVVAVSRCRPRRIAPHAIGAAIVAATVWLAPLEAFPPQVGLFDSPAASHDAPALGADLRADWVRWLGIGLAALAPLGAFAPRALGWPLVGAAVALLVWRAHALDARVLASERALRESILPIVEWLRPHVRDTDALLHDRHRGTVGTAVCQRLEKDLWRVQPDLQWFPPLSFDAASNRFERPRPTPGGRVLFLSGLPWVRHDRALATRGDLRLYDVTDGLATLVPPGVARHGIDAEGRFGARAVITVALPRPGPVSVGLDLVHADPDATEPVRVRIRAGASGATTTLVVEPGRPASWAERVVINGPALRLRLWGPAGPRVRVRGFYATPE